MALFNVFHETEADSAYDKGPIRYFDAYRLKNKGGASYHHFFDSIHTYIYINIYIYIYIEDNKFYLNNIMEKVIPKSKTKFLQNFF